MTKSKGIRRPYRRDGICPRCKERPRGINYCHPCAIEIAWMRRTGITREEYEATLAEQGGGCAVCGHLPTPRADRTRNVLRLAVDHDHITGQRRGLLCSNCNTALGLLADDPARIESLAAYRKRFAA